MPVPVSRVGIPDYAMMGLEDDAVHGVLLHPFSFADAHRLNDAFLAHGSRSFSVSLHRTKGARYSALIWLISFSPSM